MSGKAHHRKPHSVVSHPQAKHSQKPQSIEEMVLAKDSAVLKAAAAHPGMTEDIALAFLTRRDLPPAALEALTKNGSAMKHRRGMGAIVGDVKKTRHVLLPPSGALFMLLPLPSAPKPPGAAAGKK